MKSAQRLGWKLKTAMIEKMRFENFVDLLRQKGSENDAYPPELDDLYNLYSFARDKSLVSILEIGSGWSTFALALAIEENKRAFGSEYIKRVRHPNPFKVLSLDASPEWAEVSRTRLTGSSSSIVDFHISSSRILEFGGAGGPICSLIDSVPYFVADLVYLDGPAPTQVKGEIRSHRFAEPHSLPMSADLLALEPHFWPGSYIVTDGRFANAQFLRTHFRRNWEFLSDPFADRCVFRLAEPELGSVNREHLLVRLDASVELLSKEGAIW